MRRDNCKHAGPGTHKHDNWGGWRAGRPRFFSPNAHASYKGCASAGRRRACSAAVGGAAPLYGEAAAPAVEKKTSYARCQGCRRLTSLTTTDTTHASFFVPHCVDALFRACFIALSAMSVKG